MGSVAFEMLHEIRHGTLIDLLFQEGDGLFQEGDGLQLLMAFSNLPNSA